MTGVKSPLLSIHDDTSSFFHGNPGAKDSQGCVRRFSLRYNPSRLLFDCLCHVQSPVLSSALLLMCVTKRILINVIFVVSHAIRHIRHNHPQRDGRNVHLLLQLHRHLLHREIHVGQVVQPTANRQMVVVIISVVHRHDFHHSRLRNHKQGHSQRRS